MSGNQVGTAGCLLDPELSLLADNGGRTRTRALMPTSTAIDANPQHQLRSER